MKTELTGIWHLNSPKISNLPVTIPGSVLRALLEHKLIDDPFVGKNEAAARAWLYDNYTFTRKFSLAAEALNKKNYLFADGIHTIAKIYINQTPIADLCDMHLPQRILLDNRILSEENEISVEFESPYRYIEKYNDHGLFETFGLTQKKSPCIRQANYMFGWDWGPDLADIGIFRELFILSTDIGFLDSFRHECTFLSDGSARIDVTAAVQVAGQGTITAVLWSDADNAPLRLVQHAALQAQQRFVFHVDNPKRWYPVGLGEPNLYHLDFILSNAEGEVMQTSYRIGLREVRIDDQPDAYGTNFCVYVNDKKLFLKGSCYIPEDNVLSRITPERTRRLLRLVKDFHHNVVRIWGGGYYPSDDFYDVCDENGILIWQDLMFACAAYNAHDPAFRELIVKETISNVERFRHHASVFLISGDNECEDGVNGHAKELMEAYQTMSLDILVPLMKTLTSTYFLRTSPRSVEMFRHPNDLDHYDTHYWRVWCDDRPIDTYETIYPRMLSEVGHQSFPTLETIRRFAAQSELSVTSHVMQHHQKQPGSNSRIMNYVKTLYGTPTCFADEVFFSQLVQAEAMKLCAEHLRRNVHRCHGMLYWQLNDCWPGISWSSVDYFFGLKALHYASRRFFAPHLVSIARSTARLEIYVSNDTAQEQTYRLLCWNVTLAGEISEQTSVTVTVAESSAACVQTRNATDQICYVRLETPCGELLSENYYHPKRAVDTDYLPPEFVIEPIDANRFLLKANVFVRDVFLQYKDADVVFSDNFFCLQPAFPKIICADRPLDPACLRINSVNQVAVSEK